MWYNFLNAQLPFNQYQYPILNFENTRAVFIYFLLFFETITTYGGLDNYISSYCLIM